MPSSTSNIDQVRDTWTRYDWPVAGDEWSAAWGGTAYLWHGVLYPRLMEMIPAEGALEIGPGHGRITRFLQEHCRHLRLVDVTPACIEVCRKRFATSPHISFHVNDGYSLGFVPEESLDLVFSFDALVHVEEDVIDAYLAQLAGLLREDGVAFLHHSNLAALVAAGRAPESIPNPYFRSLSMSAGRFAALAAHHRLDCVAQEIFPWGALDQLSDCFSVVTRRGSRRSRPLRRHENPGFMAEARSLALAAELYGAPRGTSAAGAGSASEAAPADDAAGPRETR